MLKLGMADMKWELFVASVDLFCRDGYGDVSIRDIANAVGIKSAAIYYHFKNKDEILEKIYEFYHENHLAVLPDLESILGLINQMPPHDIFKRSNHLFGDELNGLMIKIIQIAMRERNHDTRAAKLIEKFFIEIPNKYWNAILSKMIELDMIEPLDIKTWVVIFEHYDFTMILRTYTEHALTFKEWVEGREMLFNMIRCK